MLIYGCFCACIFFSMWFDTQKYCQVWIRFLRPSTLQQLFKYPLPWTSSSTDLFPSPNFTDFRWCQHDFGTTVSLFDWIALNSAECAYITSLLLCDICSRGDTGKAFAECSQVQLALGIEWDLWLIVMWFSLLFWKLFPNCLTYCSFL